MLTSSDDQENRGYGTIAFYCPACENWHTYNVKPDFKEDNNFHLKGADGVTRRIPIWGYNNNPDCPTFTPSLRYLTDPKCHVIITDGKIHFCGDCPKMAGQTVSMVPFPGDWD